MKKVTLKVCGLFVLSALLVVGVSLFVPTHHVEAQSSGAFTTLTPIYSPPAVTITATCSTTGCPTFTLNGMCTAVLRVTGATTINTVVKVSNDAGSNYSQITPLVVGIAGNGTVTTNAIAANGIYSMTLAGMNRVRLETGTLTGASATFKLTSSGACISQAL